MTRIGPTLVAELDAWAAEGLIAHFWWRDDDAVAETRELRRLLDTAGTFRTVVAISVIPERAERSLVDAMAGRECCVWQHGWGHHFHESGEFGDGRPLSAMTDDALSGQRALDELFGCSGWQRVFVPPNHSLAMGFKALIPDLGYLGVSGGIPLTPPVERVIEINAEIDLMNWSDGVVFGLDQASEMLAGELNARRMTTVPVDRPLGLLTHHRVFNDEAWGLISKILEWIQVHPAASVLDASALFATASSNSQSAWPPSLP